MPTDILKLFSSLGLSSAETRVYLASLELGPTSVQDIAKKAKVSRTAAYQAIESLQKQGLFSTFERGKKKFFAAEDPEAAVSAFKQRMSRMEEELATLQRALPELKLMVGGERPTVRFYEGNDAVFALFGDIGKAGPKTVDEVSNLDDVYTFLDPKVLQESRKVFDPKQTKIRLLHRGALRNKTPGGEYCELLPELGDFHGDIIIYGDRVAFFAFVGKTVCVIIESQPFADTAHTLFEAAWRVCQMKSNESR